MEPTSALIFAVVFTLGVSAFCSLLEAMVLSTTTADIEALKQVNRRKGELLDRFREEIEETSSAILTLNTVANTAGATVSGAFAAAALGEGNVALFSIALVLGILVFSEILPKNIGVLYRPVLLPFFIEPLRFVRVVTKPMSWSARRMIQFLTGNTGDTENGDETEIKLLAERSATEGNLTHAESAIIANALSLDEVRIYEVMTPRTVMHAYDEAETIGEVFERQPNIPFARMPVYADSIDKVTGLVRRRDMLKAKAEDRDATRIGELAHDVLFLPENASGAHALQNFLKAHQQLAVVVDEFGSVAGVVTMEDIIEHILGQEIFERDDPAIDMRELARRRERIRARRKARKQAAAPGAA